MREYIVPPIPKTIWQKPMHFIAFGFGSGAIPIAPGTFGTLMAVPFYLALRPLPIAAYLIIVLALTVASMWICEKVSNEIKIDDHQGMCLDEFIGFLVTMINAPLGIIWILIGFGLFRLFDIWKPWPINYLDTHIHGGVGMILDDVCAGIFSLAVLQFLHWVF